MTCFWNSKAFWGWLAVVNALLAGGLYLYDDVAGAVVSLITTAGCAMMMLLRTDVD